MLEIAKARSTFAQDGLKKAIRYKIEDIDLLSLKNYILKPPFENDYKIIYDFNINELNSQEVLFLIEHLKEMY